MSGRKVFLVCYPRTASRFFAAALESKIGKLRIVKTHNRDANIRDGLFVGLIRNPLDQIASNMAMEYRFDGGPDYSTNLRKEVVVEKFGFQSKLYASIIDSIIDKSHLILDYDFFTSNPQLAVELVLDTLGEPAGEFDIRSPEIATSEDAKYLKSSKESESYEEIRNLLGSLDMSALKEKYYKALSMSKTRL